MARALPGRLHLPSGRIVRLSDHAAHRADVSGDHPLLHALDILAAPGVVGDDGGAPLDVGTLFLRDAHTLRAVLTWAGLVQEDDAEFVCENCDRAFEAAPSSRLEIGPFVDGELDDPELDAPFDFSIDHLIPPVRVAGRLARTIRLADRTVDEAMPLLRAVSAGAFDLTPSVAVAMGVVAIGPQRRASALADALAAASERAWDAIVALYDRAHYPARLVAVVRCPRCDARNDLEVPLARELCRAAPPEPPASVPAHVPSLDAFEARVREIADRVFAERGVRNIDLFIDAGVPACDDGGEPLIGSYLEGATDEAGIVRAPEVRIYYRSFLAEAARDPTFDVEAEIEETIDHELTHHLHHLAGSDPLDDHERAEIVRERVRIVGRREQTRRLARGALKEMRDFVRITWPLWVFALVATMLVWCAD